MTNEIGYLKNEQTYRMLEPGEVIQEGDEFFAYGRWRNRSENIGNTYNPKLHATTRRPIETPTLTPEQAAIVEAFKKGKEIEWFEKFAPQHCWRNYAGILLEHLVQHLKNPDFEWRIKPIEETPQPGEGWRFLEVGEKIEKGDEFAELNTRDSWTRVFTLDGCAVGANDPFKYRRRIVPVEPSWDENYIRLGEDDVLQEGDERFYSACKLWKPIVRGFFGCRLIKPQYQYRRPKPKVERKLSELKQGERIGNWVCEDKHSQPDLSTLRFRITRPIKEEELPWMWSMVDENGKVEHMWNKSEFDKPSIFKEWILMKIDEKERYTTDGVTFHPFTVTEELSNQELESRFGIKVEVTM